MSTDVHKFLDVKVRSITEWEFSTYGLQVVQLMEDDPVDRMDPMARIFPKVTKCTFRKYVPSF